MNQGNYISDKQEGQTLEQVPVLDLINWSGNVQMNGMSNIGNGTYIKTLNPACYSITVKNTFSVTDSSIVICTDSTPGSCPGTIPGTCPTSVTPAEYINFLAVIHAAYAENAVPITFQYVLNGIPTAHSITVDLAAGDNNVYAFATNIGPFPDKTTLTLYGVTVPT